MRRLLIMGMVVLAWAGVPSNGQSPMAILSSQQGLPKSQIYDIVQDSFGFIWLGTRDGLVRFDGHSMQLYRRGESGLKHNYNYDLFIDKDHQLWLASNADYAGVSVLDLSTYTFRNIHCKDSMGMGSNGIVAIDQLPSGEMVFVSKDFWLLQYDPVTKDLTSLDLNLFVANGTVEDVTDMIVHPREPHILFFCTRGSIRCFDRVKEQFVFNQSLARISPHKFFYDAECRDKLWVTLTGRGGLLSVDLRGKQPDMLYLLDHQVPLAMEMDLPNQSISTSDIARKSPLEFYVATENHGLVTFNIATGNFRLGVHATNTLQGDLVRSLFSNPQGQLWVGADKSGLYFLGGSSALWDIKLFPEIAGNNPSFRMRDLYEYKENHFLFTVFQHSALIHWNRTQDKFDQISVPNGHYGYTFTEIEDKVLMGANRGFYQVEIPSLTLRRPGSEFPELRNITQTLDQQEGFWFINWGDGIGRFTDNVDLISGGTSQPLVHHWTHDLTFDSEGDLWIGQEQGLFELDTASLSITPHVVPSELNGFSSPNFKALAFDKKGYLWTGNFGGGIYCYDPVTRQIVAHVGVENGLPSDRIYDLIIDGADVLWAWTSEGLASLRTLKGIQALELQFHAESRFLPVDRVGVWFEHLDSNQIFLGISGGFALFQPRELRTTRTAYSSKPLVTTIAVDGVELPFSRSSLGDETICLDHDQDFVHFAFSAPKDGFVARQQFAYRLIGLDPAWTDVGTQRQVSFSNLQPGTYGFSVRVKSENGSWSRPSRTVHFAIRPVWYATRLAKASWILIAAGSVVGIFLVLKYRQQLRLNLKVKALEAEQLRDLDASKTQFFTQITHEFRTPLTVILGMADQLAERSKISMGLEQPLQAIKRNGQILLQQVNQILDLSKLRSKSIELDMVHGDVIQYLRYLSESVSAHAEVRQIAMKFQYPDNAYMDYDARRLRDIFLNLLSNAIKYSDSGGEVLVSVQIVGNSESGSFLQLKVVDEGIGIPEEDIELIFQPYYRAGNTSGSGTGLGLATTHQWVQALGGRIEVESSLGAGSTFIVLLPITKHALLKDIPVDPQHTSQVESGPVMPENNTAPGSTKILIVDDNEDVLSYLSYCLAEYDLLSAQDGREALNLAIEEVPDLIVTDIMMPEMSGYELCSAIRGQSGTSHIPIVMLTAKTSQDDRNEGLSKGADAYLSKPFDRSELLIRIEKLVARQQSLQEKYLGVGPKKDPSINPREAQFLQEIEDFVLGHLDQDFSVVELAGHMLLSRVQLYRKVKALTGRSISSYVRLIRLRYAHDLLKQGLSVSEAAYASGFADPSYFTRMFKQEYNAVPSEI